MENKIIVNGIIICRKMAKKNVVFPTYFLYPKFYDIMYTYIMLIIERGDANDIRRIR